MKPSIRAQLSAMMFLQYYIWGSWYSTMGTYVGEKLNFTGQQIGLVYGTTALAAMISPFFVGMIADRFFATERVLGVLHLLGGVLIYFVSTLKTFPSFYAALLAHTLCYMPTLALTNALSFHQMKDPGKEFPSIRVLGTISWICAGWTVSMLNIENMHTQFQLAALVGIIMGIYSLFLLPHTPPRGAGTPATVRDILGLDALSLLKERSFLIFVVGSFLICIPLTFYFSFTNPFLNDLGIANAAGKMTMGQMSEIFFLLVMPFFFARLGVKYMLLFGMFCWSARYVLFAFGNNGSLVWMLYLGIILHGICYDFFFVTGQIYVDKKAPVQIRAKAQGFIAFVTLGAGMFIGSWLSGVIMDFFSERTPTGQLVRHWQEFWLAPAIGAFVVLLLFAFFFQYRESSQPAPGLVSSKA